MLTIDQAVRKDFRAEVGDEEGVTKDHTKRADGTCADSCVACRRFIIVQKYGLIRPVIDKKLNNPGWVPETKSKFDDGGETWKTRKAQYNAIINQVKRSRGR